MLLHARPGDCEKVAKHILAESMHSCVPIDATNPSPTSAMMANKTGAFCEVTNIIATDGGEMLVWGTGKLEYGLGFKI